MSLDRPRIFLLSPARIGGRRSTMLVRAQAEFDIAVRLREGKASFGEVYGFISGLYFRGKLAYTERFGEPPAGLPPSLVIVPGMGLVAPDAPMNMDVFDQVGRIDIHEENESYSVPLLRDAKLLAERAGEACRFILLGSIATAKYTDPLGAVFGERLLFPMDFVGRGDMSRGGLMLRSAQSGEELLYAQLLGATRRGPRTPKLQPIRKRS